MTTADYLDPQSPSYDPERAAAEGKAIVRDKRGSKTPKPLPTAEELLAQETAGEAEAIAAQLLLEKQAEEEAARVGAESLYEGGGLKEGEESAPKRHSVIAAFVVLLNHDGTATAGPLDLEYLSLIDTERDVTATDMFKSCHEIIKDVVAGDTAQTVVNYMQQASMAMAQQQAAARQAHAAAQAQVDKQKGRKGR
jgi:hypothetical protein